MKVSKELFSLPAEEKERYATDVANNTATGAAKIYNSSAKHYDSEEHRYWRDVLEHSANLDGKDRETWPDKPSRYRYPTAFFHSTFLPFVFFPLICFLSGRLLVNIQMN